MADVKFHCPHCDQRIECDEQLCGMMVNCPNCTSEIAIPVGRSDASQIAEPTTKAPTRQRSFWLLTSAAILLAMAATVVGVVWKNNTSSLTQRKTVAKAIEESSDANKATHGIPTSFESPTLADARKSKEGLEQEHPPENVVSTETVEENVTMTVLATGDKPGQLLSLGIGKIAATMNLAGRTTYAYDKPGSLWLVAEGSVTWKGETLAEGRIYRLDEQSQPQLTEAGDYSAWISFEQPQEVRAKRIPQSAASSRISPGEQCELLLPTRDPKGWQKIRTAGKSRIEGWVFGGWDSLVFKKRTSTTDRATPVVNLPSGIPDVKTLAPETIQFDPRLFEEVATAGPLVTHAIIKGERGGLSVYPGSLLGISLTDSGTGGPLTSKPTLTTPGSLLFIAEGGATERALVGDGNLDLKEGCLYVMDQMGRPQLSQTGEYSVWVSYQVQARIYAKKDINSQVVYLAKANEKMQLHLAGQGSKEWHKVGVPAVGAEGWVPGQWNSLKFMKHRPLSPRAEADQSDR